MFIGLESYMYSIVVCLGFIATFLIKPLVCSSILLILSSVFIYFAKIHKEYHTLCKKYNQDELEKFGLTTKNIVKFAFYGFLILMLVSIWIGFVWYLYSGASSISKFFITLAVPLTSFLLSGSQISILKNTIQKTNLFDATLKIDNVLHTDILKVANNV